MELRVLKYFLMVAREENITRAAELLHVTQPTLSRQLMQLEEELKTKLFTRGRHNIQLTDDGMLLKRRAQEIVFLEKKIEEDFLHDSDNLTGQIVIGCGETKGMNQLAKIISQFIKDNLLVNFEIHTADSDTIKENIEKGIFDFGLLLEPVDITKYDFKRIDEQEVWGVLVKEDCILANQEFVQADDLIKYPVMISNRAMVLNEISNWFGDKYNDLNVVINYNIGYNLVNLIKNDVGIAICLDTVNQMTGLKFVPLYPKLTTNSVVVWKKNQHLSPAVKTFLEYMKKCF